jgi:hypothetical protein
MPNGDAAGTLGAPAEETATRPPAERPAPPAQQGPPPAAPHVAERPPLGRAEQLAAIALIGVFLAFVVALVLLRADEHWDRLVFLLAGVEAIVFAAAGALFGTSVQRTQAVEARQAATEERERADRFESQARSGQALADVIRAKAGRAAASPDGDGGGSGGARGARPDRPPLRSGAGLPGADGGEERHLAELVQMADRGFPRAAGR